MRSSLLILMGLLVGTVMAVPTAEAVSIDWVTVNNPGNAADTTGFGAVDNSYLVSKFEITNAQYAEFLNATAASDSFNLYNTGMGGIRGGITRSGVSGSFSYGTIAGRENRPVNFVSFYDSLRFSNWLHNDQPSGAQDSTTTEDGAYTFSGETTVGARNPNARIFLTSEDEWYKAAYYDASSMSFFDYPAGLDPQTLCGAPGATANSAKCSNLFGSPVDVGSYTGSAGPYGTFDQGGNVSEWNEAVIGSNRGLRGGSYANLALSLGAGFRFSSDPAIGNVQNGFRVASPAVPEPGSGLLLVSGLLGLAWRQRRLA